MSNRLRRSGIVGGAVMGATALVALTTGLADAQESEQDISVSPSSGEPGTLITVSGEGCDGTQVVLLLLDGDTVVDEDSATPGETGFWQGTLTAPTDAGDGTQLAITADCLGGSVVYEDGFFVVEVIEPPTTTTTTQPTTSTTAPGGPGGPAEPPAGPGTTTTTRPASGGAPVRPTPAAPATPVVAQPSFTG